MNIKEIFDAIPEEDYLDFNAVENKLSQRADLHAFMVLDKLVPEHGDIISASEHDEFYLSIDCDELAKVLTMGEARDLSRCGVRYDEGFDCLCMFA